MKKAGWTDIHYDTVRSEIPGIIYLNGVNAVEKIIVEMKDVNLAPGSKYKINNVQISQ